MITKSDKVCAAAYIPLASTLVLTLVLTACDRRKAEEMTPVERTPSSEATTPSSSPNRDVTAPEPTSPVDMTANSPTASTGTVSQADALAMMVAVDEHEIAAVDQAIGKKVSGKVRDFADMMKVDHSRNLVDTTKLGAAESTATPVTLLRQKGESELRMLDGKSGKDYESAYVDAMVKGHTEALSMIDNTLLPAATDTKVRDHFTATRTAVARHLEKAKELQAAKQ
jgi:putative membrane protein